MKKILSISVIALLAMAPTMGWAAQTEVTAAVNPSSANGGTDYYTTMPANMAASGNARTDSNGAIIYTYSKGASDDNSENLIDQNGPIYKGVNISADDGTTAAAVSYVKGAYNSLIEKVNAIDTTVEVYTTWGAESHLPVANN